MPMPNQIDPYYSRERGAFETDTAYAERMAKLDKRDEFMRSLFQPVAPDKEG